MTEMTPDQAIAYITWFDERPLTDFFKRSCEAQKLTGKALARKQLYFDRMLKICALRNNGLTYKKIGESFGISGTAISVVLRRAERWIKRQLRDEEQAKSVT